MTKNGTNYVMKTNKEIVERLYAALVYFYPRLFKSDATDRAVKSNFIYKGETITREDFKSKLLSFAGTDDDIAYAINFLRKAYQDTQKIEATRPGKEELKTLEEQAAAREAAQAAAKEKGTKQTQEFIKQKQKIYAKVEVLQPEKLNEAEQKAYDEYKNAVKADPDKVKAAENLAQEIKTRVAPSLAKQGATPEEVEILSKQTAATLVEKMSEEGLPSYTPVATQAAVLSAVANDTKVVAKIVGDKTTEQIVKIAANDVAGFKTHPDILIKNITTIAFGEKFANTVFGTPPNQIKVELSETPAVGFTQTVSFENLNQAHTKIQTNQSQALELVKQFGTDQAKGMLLKQTGVFLEKKIASLPVQSLAGKILRTPEAQSLFFSTFGVGTAVKWEATNWVGGLALKFAPESAPLLSVFGKFTGINLVKPAAAAATKAVTTAGVEAGAKVAVGTATKTGLKGLIASLGLPGGPIGLALSWLASEVIVRVGGKILSGIKKFVQENKEVLFALGALGMFFGGGFIGMLSAAPLLAGGAAILGAGRFSGAALGGGIARFFGTLGSAMAISIGMPILVTLLVFPVVVALILFIINSGAYLVPPSIVSQKQSQNLYIDVQKVATPPGPFQNSNLPITIIYTITVTAKKGTLTNIKFDNVCKVIQQGSQNPCPAETPEEPQSISPSSPFIFTYEETYDGTNYIDSLVLDTFTVTADADQEKGVTTSSSAAITIGNPPTDCLVVEGAWPSDYLGNINQAVGTLVSNYSNYVSKVCLSYDKISLRYNPSGYGNYWGWNHVSYIDFYALGVGTYENTLYTMSHELGHSLIWGAQTAYIYAEYLRYPGITTEKPLCFYSDAAGVPDEELPESIAFYIIPIRSCSLTGDTSDIQNWPIHLQFLKKYVFN